MRLPIPSHSRSLRAALTLPVLALLLSGGSAAHAQDMTGGATPVATSAAPMPAPMPTKDKHAAHVEVRIKDLHNKLKITADQEALWADVAAVMRDNAEKMDGEATDRSAHLKTMSAVEDLKSYQVISDAHSDGLKKLIPAFEALYDKMSPAQQKNADHVFGEHQRHAAHQS